MELVKHLELSSGEDYLFVDPENLLYDELSLNFGVKETFFSIETPFAFLDRFSKQDGMKDLLQVLSKWNKGRSKELSLRVSFVGVLESVYGLTILSPRKRSSSHQSKNKRSTKVVLSCSEEKTLY